MKQSQLYLIHIGECLQRIGEYTSNDRNEFMGNTLVQDAVLRNLEVMGESIKQLPEEWKATEPKIEWVKIGDFRNVLAHEYLGVNLDIVWEIIERYLPDLKKAISRMSKRFL